ncbi:unnamed protein product [Eruca vesicaria subsp. sativa]|uniref:Uncharacterized protein n=1 Tax=Eruca vesicaria subsp. sativa TaxID=29727 RepID=A0ABC8L216_ERUVS|nr:unnamed protein product [Eruca vesicaria subsp. sativa]
MYNAVTPRIRSGSEMEEEQQDKKAHKAYYDMLQFVTDVQKSIPKLCPCGSITKEIVDEEDSYNYLPGKRFFICKDYEVKMLISRVSELERAM